MIELKDDILKGLHQVQIEMLDEIVRICQKHNLTYFLTGGSALGAVRHKGFIPWDDDIDLCMPRADYEKFIEICKTELKDDYYLDNGNTNKEFLQVFTKIRKKNTLFREKDLAHLKEHNEIFVDIFPFDNIKEKGLILKFQVVITRAIIATLLCRVGAKKKEEFKRKYLITIFDNLSTENLQKLYKKVACMYNNKNTEHFTNFSSPYRYDKEIFLKDKFLPTVDLEFEGKKYKCPKDYDYYLTKLYGDYMKLPPKDKMVNHSVLEISFDTRKKQKESDNNDQN